jgi:Tol biopolymer transport system component
MKIAQAPTATHAAGIRLREKARKSSAPSTGHEATHSMQPINEGSPTFHTDGRRLAYSSDTYGRHEIYVQPYPGPRGNLQRLPNPSRLHSPLKPFLN